MHSSYWQRLLGSDRDGDLEDIVRSGAPGFSRVSEPPNTILQQPNVCLLPDPPGPDPAAGGSSLLASQKLLEEEMRKLSGCDLAALRSPPAVDLALSGSSPVATDVAVPGQISSLRSAPAAAIKRRKSQAKKVVCIPAPASTGSRQSGEVVPSDLWAWRKYGQKPIKGSPYPRGYYRCSSSKGCSARKQVERSRTDPNMLVITYTSEHNHPWPTHRNALAGSTRPHSMKITSNPCSSISTSTSAAVVLPDACNGACTGAQLMKEEEMEIDGRMPLGEHASFHSDDPFVGLGELAPEPADLVFPREFLEGDDAARASKMLPDPFSLLDWGGSSFEPKSDWL